MAINNVYSQTPKRIYTNKPFMNGMVYTNSDLNPGVCKVVSNLDLEASNTATRLRPGTENKAVTNGTESNIIFKFFSKFVMFDSYISENNYKYGVPAQPYNKLDNTLGLSVLDTNMEDVHTIYPSIVYNDTSIEFNNDLITLAGNPPLVSSLNNLNIYPLKMDDGTYPHCVNSSDYSFAFFGSIEQSSLILYRGLIKLYFHAAAKQVFIEVINPYTTSHSDVSEYGANLIAKNPLVYRDYVYYSGAENNYNEVLDASNMVNIETVQFYDRPVNTSQFHSASESTDWTQANIVKGVNRNSNTDEVVYLRPYLSLPKHDYSAVVSYTDPDSSNTYFYNFEDKEFNIKKTSDGVMNEHSVPLPFEQISPVSSSKDLENFKILEKGELEANLCAIDNEWRDNTRIRFDDFSTSFMSSPIISLLTNSEAAKFISDKDINLNKALRSVKMYSHSFLECVIDSSKAIDTLTYSEIPDNKTHPLSLRIPVKLIEHSELYDTSYSTDDPNYASVTYPGSEEGGYRFVTIDLDQVLGSSQVSYNSDVEITMYNPSSFDGIDNLTNFTLYAEYNGRFYPIDGTSYNQEVTSCVIDKSTATILERTDDLLRIKVHIAGVFPKFLYGSRMAVVYPTGYKSVPDKTRQKYIVRSQRELSQPAYLNVSFYKDNEFIKVMYKFHITPFDTSDKFDASREYSNFYTSSEHVDDTVYSLETYKQYKYALAIYTHVHSNLENNYISLNSFSGEINQVYYGIEKSALHTLQYTDSVTNEVAHNFSIPIYISSLNHNLFDSAAIVSFKVYIITTFKDDITQDIASVSTPLHTSASPPLQITLNSTQKIYHDSLKAEYDVLASPHKLTTHLGHYVYYNPNTETNSLYYSIYGDPSYFPSNYIITLNNPIVHIHPHQGNLIVFTTDDIYLIYNGNVPSTTSQDGSEVAFTVKLIQSNIRLGDNVDTVKSIGKDVFFITQTNDGYLLKTNKYVNDSSDVYLMKITNAIAPLLSDPYKYISSRFTDYSKLDVYNPHTLEGTTCYMYDIPDNLDYFSVSSDAVTVIDGDTFECDIPDLGTVRIRLASIDTPELTGVPQRLARQAKNFLQQYINKSEYIDIYLIRDVNNNYVTTYNRYVSYVFGFFDYRSSCLNAELLRNGYAKLAYDDYSSGVDVNTSTGSQINLGKFLSSCSDFAKHYNLGVYNTLEYSDILISDTVPNFIYPDIKVNKLFTHASNSYIYIIQSIIMESARERTIIYKYSIDTRIWIMYEFDYAMFPYETFSDTSKLGFALCCSNSYMNKRPKASIFRFNDTKQDYNNVVNIVLNDVGGDGSLAPNVVDTLKNITVYFDSGNQSISIMNDKLFREVKLVLGDATGDLLNVQYDLKMYIDDKLVKPTKHYVGSQNNEDGIRDITFFTPARGRIPKIIFTIDCNSDINILQYAIVYMQLNAK